MDGWVHNWIVVKAVKKELCWMGWVGGWMDGWVGGWMGVWV